MNTNQGNGYKNSKEQGTTSEILDEISLNLSRQIMEEMDQNITEDDKSIDEINRESTEEMHRKEKPEEGRRKPKMSKVVFSLILGLVCILLNTALINYSIRAANALNKINHLDDNDIENKEPDLSKGEDGATPAPVEQVPTPENSDKVVNILLIGEENVYGDSIGRSDSMMIATINGQQKSLKLTSLMRDVYISIPGYLPNKLNAAYNNGGGKLLTDTVEQNFGIPIDGYVVVNFEGLETIIDLLGGVEVTLTSDEAYYLNTTNYVSKPEYRYLAAGTQVLNGNQAVGYCRVRYRTASNGESNDFGRTYRQRTVLTSLFNSYKNKSLNEMLSIANDILPYVSTDMTRAQLIDYIIMAVSQGTTDLETLRIPVDRTYYNASVPCGYSYSDALAIDYTENIRIMNEFIYGADNGGNGADTDPSSGDMEDGGYYDEYGVYHSKNESSTSGLTPPENYVPNFQTYGN